MMGNNIAGIKIAAFLFTAALFSLRITIPSDTNHYFTFGFTLIGKNLPLNLMKLH
jgi:hypothetical protein